MDSSSYSSQQPLHVRPDCVPVLKGRVCRRTVSRCGRLSRGAGHEFDLFERVSRYGQSLQ